MTHVQIAVKINKTSLKHFLASCEAEDRSAAQIVRGEMIKIIKEDKLPKRESILISKELDSRLLVRVDAETKIAFQKLAASHDSTVSQEVRQIVRRFNKSREQGQLQF